MFEMFKIITQMLVEHILFSDCLKITENIKLEPLIDYFNILTHIIYTGL